MNPMKSATRLFAVAVMMAMSTLVAAHGTDEHAKKVTLAKKEQKDWGIAGAAKLARRTIEVSMLDTMKFSPDSINIKVGETVKFVLKNTGGQLHEFVIGTKKENAEHAALMLKFPNMEHDEPYMAHVPAGKTGEIIWKFNRVGNFDFACLIPGHYQAGMIGKIIVAAAGKSDEHAQHKR